MSAWCVATTEYDVDLKSLYARRLAQSGAKHALTKRGAELFVTVKGDNALAVMAEVTAKVLCRDLQYFVLAKMVDRLPLRLQEKQLVLTDALRSARTEERLMEVTEGLCDFLKDTRDLCLDGYMQFRMQSTILRWQLCIEQVATEILMRKEYHELKDVLELYTESCGSRISELQLCIHADGTCTLTDDSQIRIEYVDCSIEGIVSLLVNMAPKRLIVYDLSGSSENRLTEAIAKVFCGRVKIYK